MNESTTHAGAGSADQRINCFPDRPSDAITGLRFFAALSVANAHGMLALAHYVNSRGEDLHHHITPLSLATSLLSGLGMSVFFVLSGFVIHYNYFDRLKTLDRTQFHNFVVARFARLFPLYFTVLALEMLIGKFLTSSIGDRVTAGYSPEALPYFLTMSQTWVWKSLIGQSLVYQYGEVSQISWSIATEWFFYMSYPAIALLFSYLKTVRTTLLLAVAYVVVVGAGFIFILSRTFSLNSDVVAGFGPLADWYTNHQDSFLRWLLYFSPYGRIMEFLAGCLVGHLFLLCRARGYGLYPVSWSSALTTLAVAVIAGTHVIILMPAVVRLPPWFVALHMNFGYTMGIMLLLFCVASAPSGLQRFLSSRPVVLGGDISYSIYLLHMALWPALHRPPVGPDLFPYFILLIRYVAALGVLLFLAYATYRLFELPARTKLRVLLSRSPEQGGFRPRDAVVAAIVLAPIAAIAWGEIAPRLGPQRILDVAARYGGSCGVTGFHDSRAVAAACKDRLICTYKVDVRVLGDPAGGCPKDFFVIWKCSGAPGMNHQLAIPAEAGFGSVAHLSCASPAQKQ